MYPGYGESARGLHRTVVERGEEQIRGGNAIAAYGLPAGGVASSTPDVETLEKVAARVRADIPAVHDLDDASLARRGDRDLGRVDRGVAL